MIINYQVPIYVPDKQLKEVVSMLERVGTKVTQTTDGSLKRSLKLEIPTEIIDLDLLFNLGTVVGQISAR